MCAPEPVILPLARPGVLTVGLLIATQRAEAGERRQSWWEAWKAAKAKKLRAWMT